MGSEVHGEWRTESREPRGSVQRRKGEEGITLREREPGDCGKELNETTRERENQEAQGCVMCMCTCLKYSADLALTPTLSRLIFFFSIFYFFSFPLLVSCTYLRKPSLFVEISLFHTISCSKCVLSPPHLLLPVLVSAKPDGRISAKPGQAG